MTIIVTGGSYNKGTGAEVFYILLAKIFCAAVCADGSGNVTFCLWNAAIARKNIVGGNVDKLCSYILAGNCKISGAYGIYLESVISVGLTAVNICVSGTVYHSVIFFGFKKSLYRLDIGNVKLVHIN